MFDDWDTSHFMDTDWAELNRLKRAYEDGGLKGFATAVRILAQNDPVQFVIIAAAVAPHKVREAAHDAMAEIGLTLEDLQEIIAAQKNRQTH